MGTSTARRACSALVALAVVLGGLLISSAPAQAATYQVVGQITGPQAKLPKITMRWFTKDWTYLGQKKVSKDIYTLSLAPGTYHLQFVDNRPAYDVTKYAPADITVTIKDRKIQRNVRMQRGAAVTGTVKAGGRALGGARVVAANTYEQSYETKANGAGQFAIGGLPSGKYSVFTYDRTGTWVDKSTFAGKVQRGKAVNVAIKLKKKGGSLLVDLFHGDGRRASGKFAVTAISKKTGQWWTETARSGKVTFRGLYPGSYTLVAPGNGDWLARTGPIQGAKVRAGRADLASRFVWTQRGASVSGRIVDAEDPGFGLGGAQVLLFDKTGRQVGSTLASASGAFRFGGQLTTQTGMAIVALPKPNGGGWMTTRDSYCLFTRVQEGGVSVATNRDRAVGVLLLPRSTASAQPESCLPA